MYACGICHYVDIRVKRQYFLLVRVEVPPCRWTSLDRLAPTASLLQK